MNEKAKSLRNIYKAGVRVRLTNMDGEPQMPQGLEGKVDFVDDAGQIHVKWENGSTLALIEGVDKFEIVE
jgi:hypothetical protein